MFRTIAFAAVLALSPGLALAMGGCSGHDQTVQQCGEGQFYDATLGLCVDKATS